MGQKTSKVSYGKRGVQSNLNKEDTSDVPAAKRKNEKSVNNGSEDEIEIIRHCNGGEDPGEEHRESNTRRGSQLLDKHGSFHFLTTQSRSSLFDEPLLDESLNEDDDLDDKDDFNVSEDKAKSQSNSLVGDTSNEPLSSPIRVKVRNDNISDTVEEIDDSENESNQESLEKDLSISLSSDDKDSGFSNSQTSPSTLKSLLLSPKFSYDSEEEEISSGENDEAISGAGITTNISPPKPPNISTAYSNPFSILQDAWSKRKLENRKAAYSAVGPILRPAYLHLSNLYIDRIVEENQNKIYVLVTSVDCRKYDYPISAVSNGKSPPPWKIRGQIKSKPFYLKSGSNNLKERLLLPAVSSDTVLVISLVQTSKGDDALKLKSKIDNAISEDHEPDYIWAQAFYAIHDVKCTVENTYLQLRFQLPTETKDSSKPVISPSQSLLGNTISPTSTTSLIDRLPFPFESYHTDISDYKKKENKRIYFPIHLYATANDGKKNKKTSLPSDNSDIPQVTIKGEIEFVHNSRGSAGKVVVLLDHKVPAEKNPENMIVETEDSHKSVFADDYHFDNNVTQDVLSLDEIEYEEITLEDPRNQYWLVIAKEIYLLKSYLDTNKLKVHQLCDINYVNGPLIGHCTKSIVVQIGDERPWRIVTTNEEEYLHWFQILNALSFESNFLESDVE